MRKIYNYIMLAVVALTTVGCVDDLIDPNTPSTGNGDDVQFGLAFADLETRTIYGAEANDAFPIYWSNGDKVLVASPQCAVKSAEYEVTPVSGQSYAEAMNKAGAAGVQWGAEAADFYSIYPADKASWNTLEADKVIANLSIDSEQSANIVTNNNVYSSADMDNVIMYARTIGAQNGETVNLKYIPYSTILEFEVAIAQNTDDQGNLANWGSAKVMSMTLTAPDNTPIAGDFTFRFDGDNRVVTAAGNNINVITIDFTTQPLLNETNQKLYVKFALIPSADIDITKSGWTVDLEVLEGNDTETTTYTKTLAISTALKPGQIHKIKLPKLRSTEAWDPSENMDKWITTLYDYKNIYLTELSVPGAWYAGAPTGDGYQSTDNIETLWNKGVRAFAVECRTLSGFNLFGGGTPEAVVVSGTGRNSTYDDYRDPLTGSATKIRSIIASIANQVANSVVKENNTVVDGEYAVLVLSYADGGEGGHRDQDHAYFINGIKTEIAQSGVTNNIYGGKIDANTTINDVLGKLIIKVNVDENLPIGSYTFTEETDGTITGGMSALISYNPFLQQLPEGTNFDTPLFSKLYWSEWKDSYKKTTTNNSSDFLWCFSSANRTQVDTGTDTTIPTYAQRQTALRSMITESKGLTENSAHNIWFYFNAGGTQTTSQTNKTTSATDFASNMNKWLLDVIKLKANGGTDTEGVMGIKGAYVESDPSPLGIVMFNQCTNSTYYGPEIINEIVHMNNKFKLLRAGADDGGEGDGVLD